jgi:hypothetical protein
MEFRGNKKRSQVQLGNEGKFSAQLDWDLPALPR